MGELRFRAWHKEERQMMVEWHNHIHFNGQIYTASGFNCTDKVVLMQFTGLLDKNGKEIYEGDVVDVEQDESFVITRFEDSASFVGSGTFTGKIRWVENREHFRNEFQINLSTCEVIGNIYENPELLK